MTAEMISIEQMTSIVGTRYRSSWPISLMAIVDQGASVGFLPPLEPEDARAYWAHAIEPDNIVFLVARREGAIVGTVQLEWSPKKNGRHRAEVNKLLVHPNAQRLGIGRKLMDRLEAHRGRKRLDHPAPRHPRRRYLERLLPISQGWIRAGIIPRWAESANGSLDGTVFYYKLL